MGMHCGENFRVPRLEIADGQDAYSGVPCPRAYDNAVYVFVVHIVMDPTSLSQLRSALQAAASRRDAAAAAGPTEGGSDFGKALDSALKEVSLTEKAAQTLQKDFVAGVDGVTLEQTMVAAQKSQLAFQATLTVRNRLVAAYTDIMNMQV